MEESPEITLREAKNPGEFLIFHGNRGRASQIAPKKQAERLLSEKKIKDHHLVVILGLGNPHILEILETTLREGQILLCIDKETGVFFPLFEKFLEPSLQKAGRHIFLGENSLPLLWNYLESLPIEKLTGVLFLRNPGDCNSDPEFYDAVGERISKLFSSKMSDLLTKFEFERIWVKNTLCNTIQFLNGNPPRFRIKDLENSIQNIPAVLVSAGPGLRRQCDLLKKIREKVFVLSCDTSYKVLQKFDIQPDGIFTLDAQTHSFFHFTGEDFSGIPLFADMVASPQLLRSIPFLSIIHSQTAKYQISADGKPFREATAGSIIADKFLGDTGDIQSGGSVATTAFDALRFMGFQTIFLFGQDLAYTGREIHSTGTHHNEKWLTLLSRTQTLEKINEAVVRKRETRLVPSSDGGEVLTDYVLDIYRNWFEESILNVDMSVYNVSEGGALIKNMPNITLHEAEELLIHEKPHGYPWHEFAPWKKNSSEVSNQGNELKEAFSKELRNLQKEIKEIESEDPEFIISFLNEQLKGKPYLHPMIRKTEIYLKRHDSELDVERKKELLLNSIQKEIRFLKKGLLSV